MSGITQAAYRLLAAWPEPVPHDRIAVRGDHRGDVLLGPRAEHEAGRAGAADKGIRQWQAGHRES
jgi:hypothetical protein